MKCRTLTPYLKTSFLRLVPISTSWSSAASSSPAQGFTMCCQDPMPVRLASCRSTCSSFVHPLRNNPGRLLSLQALRNAPMRHQAMLQLPCGTMKLIEFCHVPCRWLQRRILRYQRIKSGYLKDALGLMKVQLPACAPSTELSLWAESCEGKFAIAGDCIDLIRRVCARQR